MFKYLDGSIKWAMKELKALETFNDKLFKKLNVKVYIGMDSLVSNACNMSMTINVSSCISMNNNTVVNQLNSQVMVNKTYYNSFNNNIVKQNPIILNAISQHVNQLINTINELLLAHDGIERKSNYVELMSTAFEDSKGEA